MTTLAQHAAAVNVDLNTTITVVYLSEDNARKAARIEKLEAALRKIEKMPWPNSESPYALIARAALAEGDKT